MNRSFRFRISHLLYALGFVLLIATEGSGQITIGGGNIMMPTITMGIAGGQLVNVINATATLAYYTPPGGGKDPNYTITVSAFSTGQPFGLSVLAINMAGVGVAAPEVPLSSADVNFITGLGKNDSGNCNLRYTTSATFDQGNGTGVYTITYTIIQL